MQIEYRFFFSFVVVLRVVVGDFQLMYVKFTILGDGLLLRLFSSCFKEHVFFFIFCVCVSREAVVTTSVCRLQEGKEQLQLSVGARHLTADFHIYTALSQELSFFPYFNVPTSLIVMSGTTF